MDGTTEAETRKPYKIKDVSRTTKKAMVAGNLDEMREKAREKFQKEELPRILLDLDGTEIDEDEYFQTLEAGTELVAVFPGEEWADPTQYVTITTRRDSSDATDSAESEKIHLQKLVGQLRSNLYSVSVLTEADLEILSNMDPNSVQDITGKDFIEQLKETSGRILLERRQANDAIELLRMLSREVNLEILRSRAADAAEGSSRPPCCGGGRSGGEAAGPGDEKADPGGLVSGPGTTKL